MITAEFFLISILIQEKAPPSPPPQTTTQIKDDEKTTTSRSTPSGKEPVIKEENKQESMSLLLPKLIRAERTKKPPRAIWPRWYPPTGIKMLCSLNFSFEECR